MLTSRASNVLYFFKSVKVILYLSNIPSKVSFCITVWTWYLTYVSSALILPIILFVLISDGLSSFISSFGSSFSSFLESSAGIFKISSLLTSLNLGSSSVKSTTSASVLFKNSFKSFSSANSIKLCSPLTMYSMWTCNSSLLFSSYVKSVISRFTVSRLTLLLISWVNGNLKLKSSLLILISCRR